MLVMLVSARARRPVRVYRSARVSTQGDYGDSGQALLFALLRLPQLVVRDVANRRADRRHCWGSGSLANNSELVVMRTAGLSVATPRRHGGACPVLVLMVVMGLVGEYIGPPLDYFARTMRDEAQGTNRTIAILAMPTWIKDGLGDPAPGEASTRSLNLERSIPVPFQ